MFFGQGDSTILSVALFWIVFYTWFGSEIFIGWKLRARDGATQSDAGSRSVLITSIWLGVALGIALSEAMPSSAFTSGRRLLFYIGLALMVIGMALRWYSIRVLGRWFTTSVAIRPDQKVVAGGPYRWIRHPSYTGGLLTVLGIFVCLTNPLSLVGMLPPLAGYAYRIRVEERTLVRSLGQPYLSYMRRTKRLLPFLV